MVTKEIETQKTLLTVKNLSVSFDTEEGPATAADQVDFQIMKGENVGLVGGIRVRQIRHRLGDSAPDSFPFARTD
ncbi:MAG: hypothetical protein R2860_07535 [Desulfobacterales bacterium]